MIFFNHIREFTNEDNSRHPADTILSDSHKFQKSAHLINKHAINILIESLHIAINFSDQKRRKMFIRMIKIAERNNE
jgi:hypothetical protein